MLRLLYLLVLEAEETREMGGKIHHSTTDDKTYHEAECNVLSW